MHLMYLTFGKSLSIHLQAAFSIYSMLLHSDGLKSIHVVTDSPEFYNHLKDKIQIIEVSTSTITEWKGENDVFFRTKIKAIELLCGLYPNEPIMYLDTDTFAFKDLKNIVEVLQQGKAIMHEKEGPLCKEKGKTQRRMWSKLANKTIAKIPMLATDSMWNAGVVAFPNNKDRAECTLALAICDAISDWGLKSKRLFEQYAFSIALENIYGLAPANTNIAHYWGNKTDWNKLIADFFLTKTLGDYSLEDSLRSMKELNLNLYPIKQKEKNTANKLHLLVDKWFPIKHKKYIQEYI